MYYVQVNVIYLKSVSFNTTKQYRTDVSLVLEWFTYCTFSMTDYANEWKKMNIILTTFESKTIAAFECVWKH